MKENLNREELDDLARIIKVLDEEMGEPPRQRPVDANGKPLGITVREYMTEKGCTETIARRLLEEAITQGVLVKCQMVYGKGSSPYVYFLKEDYSDQD